MVGLGRELGDPMLGDARLGDTPDRPPQTCSRHGTSLLELLFTTGGYLHRIDRLRPAADNFFQNFLVDFLT